MRAASYTTPTRIGSEPERGDGGAKPAQGKTGPVRRTRAGLAPPSTSGTGWRFRQIPDRSNVRTRGPGGSLRARRSGRSTCARSAPPRRRRSLNGRKNLVKNIQHYHRHRRAKAKHKKKQKHGPILVLVVAIKIDPRRTIQRRKCRCPRVSCRSRPRAKAPSRF